MHGTGSAALSGEPIGKLSLEWTLRVAAAALCFISIASCGRPRLTQPVSPGATIETDSTRYTVTLGHPYYRVRIGFVYKNTTDGPVSANYCRTPGPPLLEKDVSGIWVRAYNPIILLCSTQPPFRVAAGHEYRGALDVVVAPRGLNFGPELLIDSIPGRYRLRWVLRAGLDPNDAAAGWVEATSTPFQLVSR